MTNRTMRFEIAVASDHTGTDRYWLQSRFSDGDVKPWGELFASDLEVLQAMEERVGCTYGAEHVLVRMPYVPGSGQGFRQ